MEYLRVIVSSRTRGQLYRKDFEVQKVFDTFVRRQVSKLIDTGEILASEYYSALIIPGYGSYKHERHDGMGDAGEKATGRAWLALKVTDPLSPTPMNFFTLELFYHFGGHFGPTDRRSTDVHRLLITTQKYVTKFEGLTFFSGNFVHFNAGVFLDFVLFSGNFHDCKHKGYYRVFRF